MLFSLFSFCFGDIFKPTIPDVLFQYGCDVFYLNFLQTFTGQFLSVKPQWSLILMLTVQFIFYLFWYVNYKLNTIQDLAYCHFRVGDKFGNMFCGAKCTNQIDSQICCAGAATLKSDLYITTTEGSCFSPFKPPSSSPPFNPWGFETWGTFNYLHPQLSFPLATEWSTGFLLLTEASVPE